MIIDPSRRGNSFKPNLNLLILSNPGLCLHSYTLFLKFKLLNHTLSLTCYQLIELLYPTKFSVCGQFRFISLACIFFSSAQMVPEHAIWNGRYNIQLTHKIRDLTLFIACLNTTTRPACLWFTVETIPWYTPHFSIPLAWVEENLSKERTTLDVLLPISSLHKASHSSGTRSSHSGKGSCQIEPRSSTFLILNP